MEISIILLAQHDDLLKQCLSRIRLHTAGDYELIVINDGASAEIDRRLRLTNDIHIVTNEQRVGVAKGFNQGAALAKSDRLLFMRDHMMVAEGWLTCLSVCLDKHPDAAMAGPRSNGVSGAQRIYLDCGSLQQLDHAAEGIRHTKAGMSRQVNRLLSSLLLVRKEAFERLGGFDERFGLESYEDDDLCYRALQAGWNLYVADDCFVMYVAPPSLFPDNPTWYTEQLARNKERAHAKWGVDLSEALRRWRHRPTVSLCMIVKNEEATLDRCLSSVRELVDEIVIVDTGSTDRTKQIAARYADRIEDFVWVDDFAKARNYVFSLASQDYVLWLDADDIVLPSDADKFAKLLLELEPDIDSVSMVYNIAFDEEGNVTTSLRRNRLVKRAKQFRWIGIVHEYLEVCGKTVYSDICITHDRKHTNSSRNLNIYEARFAAGDPFSAREVFYFANELYDHTQWERANAMYEQFLQRTDGWVEDRISACSRSADCLTQLGKEDEAWGRVMQSFAYALPRAEQCCKLGYYCMLKERYEEAVQWYTQALHLPKPEEPNAIIAHAYWTWLPHLQLCVCYDRLGQTEQANYHNEEAARYVPNDSRVLANRNYFKQIIRISGGNPDEKCETIAI